MKAIIFDFDGTLADTIPAITVGVNNALCEMGHPSRTYSEVLGFINHGARELIRQALPPEYRDDAGYVDRALVIYNRTYAAAHLQTTCTYPGMDALVADLHRSFRIGVLSNKQTFLLTDLTAQVLPAGSYDAVQGFESDHPGKPDPYLSRKIAAQLGVDPSECVMVGDSDVDILTARNAGMAHIGVSWGYRSAEFLYAAGASRVVSTVPELAAALRPASGL